jgi:hypothetical protein
MVMHHGLQEMLARSLQDGHSVSSAPGAVHHQGHASLASQAKGVVFFATPHFGSMVSICAPWHGTQEPALRLRRQLT